MAKIASIAGLFAMAASLAAATPLPQGGAPIFVDPTKDYQGELSFTGDYANCQASCGSTQVSSGGITDDQCTEFYTYGVGFQESDQDCTLQLYKGSTTCEGTPISVPIPAGSSLTCVNTGVLDGGDHYLASGIYTCP